MSSARNKAAIVGIGASEFMRGTDKSALDLAHIAISNAIADSGIDPHSIDGVLSYSLNDSVPVTTMARVLGLPKLRWHQDIYGGGSQCASILWDAAMAIESGLAETIVIYRSLLGRSGKRMGQINVGSADGLEEQFLTPYGCRGPVNTFALCAQRWLFERNLNPQALANVVVAQRQHAINNPNAYFKSALSEEDYFAAPMIASPLRRLDCCLETDAACALIVTRADLARSNNKQLITIRGAVRGGGSGGSYWDKAQHLDQHFSHFIADQLYKHCDLQARDIDSAYLYDAYSYLIPAQLEDFGFCKHGQAIDFITAGNTQARGPLPVNSNGGMLSEGYVHGLNNIVEAVRQLRGTQGQRQLDDVSTALCTGFGGRFGSAAILERLQ